MTFTRTNGLTSCDTCHALVGPSWREKSEHDGTHVRGAQLAARQARIDAATRAQTRCASTILALDSDRLGSGTNEPASVLALTGSSTPLVTTRKEA